MKLIRRPETLYSRTPARAYPSMPQGEEVDEYYGGEGHSKGKQEQEAYREIGSQKKCRSDAHTPTLLVVLYVVLRKIVGPLVRICG